MITSRHSGVHVPGCGASGKPKLQSASSSDHVELMLTLVATVGGSDWEFIRVVSTVVDTVTRQLPVDAFVIVTVEATATTVVSRIFCDKTKTSHIQILNFTAVDRTSCCSLFFVGLWLFPVTCSQILGLIFFVILFSWREIF